MLRGRRVRILSLVLILVALLAYDAISAPRNRRTNPCPEYARLVPPSKKAEEWQTTPNTKIPILIRGGNESSFHQRQDKTDLNDNTVYDSIIVGGGLAGLTAGVYLTDAKKSVLMLEKESSVGGLAAGGERFGVRFARGAAYFSKPDGTQVDIFKHIGLSDYDKKFHIEDPIDSYLWNGKLYNDVWEPEALSQLPKSFALFKRALELSQDKIATQPIEDSHLLQWDHMTAAEWIRRVPRSMAARRDPESQKLYAEFKADGRIDHKNPMKEVEEFLNLYCRSALGRESYEVGATGFVNFYISEIVPRYTGQFGTGDIAARMEEMLKSRPETFKVRTETKVTHIQQTPNGVEVFYERDGRSYSAKARKLVFSAPLGMAPKLIDGFEEMAPKQAKVLKEIEYAHYGVHNVFIKGHPWRKAYDLWVRDSNYSLMDPTDIILGRWQDPNIAGYAGMRDPKTPIGDEQGVLTVYQPLPKEVVGSGYNDKQAIDFAEKSVERAIQMMTQMLGKPIEIQAIESNRWPFSIHIPKPLWLTKAKVLNLPIGHIYLANNNMGLPSVEEAMYRGWRAALKIAEELDKADAHRR